MGTRIGTAADQNKAPSDSGRIEELLTRLSEDGFVDVQTTQEDEPIPTGAGLMIVLGAGEESGFRINELVISLGSAAAEAGAPVAAIEPASSLWSAVQIVRADERASALVSTVDAASTIAGQTAAILTLEEVFSGVRGRHYGVGAGAEGAIPQPVPTG